MKQHLCLALTTAALAAALSATADGPKAGESPADHLPPHITQVTWFGERADWSHDGKRILFLTKTFGDAMEIELATGRIRNLTARYTHHGYTRALYLSDGNTLLHRQRAAAAAFEQAAAQYRSTVLTAVQNVADTLYALQADAESLAAAVLAERAAKRTLDLTLKQQQLGYTNYLALLSAQQAYQQTVITRVQAQANRFADTAALFLALGGGWWNRLDPAAAPHAD